MDRQAIFLSDEKMQDLEGYPNDSKNSSKLPIYAPSAASEPAEKTTPFTLVVKWALIGSLILFVMIFFERQSSKASSFIRKTMLVAYEKALQHLAGHPGYYGEIPKICPDTKYRKTLSFDFPKPTNLAFVQESLDSKRHGPEFEFVRTVGKVEVLKQDSLASIRIALDIRSSAPHLTSSESLSIVKSSSALTVKTPRRASTESSSADGIESPCIYVAATIWIPSGTTLENFGINTETLSVTFFPGLDYAVTNCTEVGLTPVLYCPILDPSKVARRSGSRILVSAFISLLGLMPFNSFRLLILTVTKLTSNCGIDCGTFDVLVIFNRGSSDP